MVHPAFDISNSDLSATPENCRLLIEISGQAFNYILFTRSPDQLFLLRQYRIYTSADKTNRDILEEIIAGDDILQKYAHQAAVVYNFPEASLLPADKFSEQLKLPVTRLLHGNTDHHFVFDEEVRDQQLRNIYVVSRDLHALLREKFSGSQYWHLYSLILLWQTESDNTVADLTRVIFYNDKFIASVYKNGKLQVVQTFAYQTPEDAAYYLLLICKQFQVVQQSMTLKISGLIDAQSALYTELLKYFEHVEYEGVPDSFGTNGLLDEYPAHYFSPLLKMSLCV